MTKAITDAEFDAVTKSDKPVLIDFWAPWCGPCKIMGPVMDELAKEYEGKVDVVKMNVDENLEVPGRFNVMSIPTFVIMKDGKPVKSFVGVRSKEDIRVDLDAVLG